MADSQHMICHCKWTIDCDSEIDDTRFKVDLAAKDIDLISGYLMTSTHRSPLYMHSPSIQGSPHHMPCRGRTAVHHRRSSGLPIYAPSQRLRCLQCTARKVRGPGRSLTAGLT